MKRVALVSAVLILASALWLPTAEAGASRIVRNADGSCTLYHNSAPYFAKGGGTDHNLTQMAAAGGNSVRTWGAGTDPTTYDQATAAGLTVCAGLWMIPTGQMNYADAGAVASQYNSLMAHVNAYKNHPAILAWGIGNEYEGAGTDPNVWRAVQQLAAGIKAADPNHITLTVLAGLDGNKMNGIRTYCPSLDVVGINTYGAMPNLPSTLVAVGIDRPYMVTEFGLPGPWGEAPRTPWGASIEPTSTSKEATYLSNWQTSIQNAGNATVRNLCVGGYAYYWGVEPRFCTTHTWFEMFLPGGGNEWMGSANAMKLAWSGSYPANRCPQMTSLTSTASQAYVAPSGQYLVTATVTDPEGDALTCTWEVRYEMAGSTGPVGAVGPAPAVVPGCITQTSGKQAIFTVPATAGAYRLFAYAKDGHGNAATANFPFYSNPGTPVPPAPAPLPGEPDPDPVPPPDPGNTAPTAVQDAYDIPLSGTFTQAAPGVLANDTDPDDDAMTAVLVDNYTTGLGTLTLNANGSFSFTPSPTYPLQDGNILSFTYQARDTSGATSTKVMVLMTLRAAEVPAPAQNQAPTAVADAYDATIGDVLNVAAAGVLANDSDPDGDPLTAVLINDNTTAAGTLVLNADGSFSFTQTAGDLVEGNIATFTYKAKDDENALSAAVTVTLTFRGAPAPDPGPNQNPVAVQDAYDCTVGATLTVAAAAGVLANDSDADGDALTAVLVNDYTSSLGTLTLNADGSFTFVPAHTFRDGDIIAFTYEAMDTSDALSAETNVIITMRDSAAPPAETNTAPTAAGDAYDVTIGETLDTAAPGVLANDSDADGDIITAVLVSDNTAAAGTLTLNADGSFRFTPTGPALADGDITTFTYQARDAAGASSVTTTVTLTFRAAAPDTNRAPTAVGDAYDCTLGETLVVPAAGFLANDTDADGNPLTATLVNDYTTDLGNLTFNADGSFTFEPTFPYFQSGDLVGFTYQVSDGAGGTSSPATVLITMRSAAAPLPEAFLLVGEGEGSSNGDHMINDTLCSGSLGATPGLWLPLTALALAFLPRRRRG